MFRVRFVSAHVRKIDPLKIEMFLRGIDRRRKGQFGVRKKALGRC